MVMHMAPGIQLEPETFYQLKNSYGLYLDGTNLEGIPGVTGMALFFIYIFLYGHPRRGNHDIATLRHSILTYISHSCLQTFFSRQAKVCYFLLF
jgi:hypothetical protein